MPLADALLKLNNRISLVTPALIRRKPRFLLKAAGKLLARKFFHADGLWGVELAPHYACNFHCKHCYEKKFRETENRLLTLQEQKRIIQECLDHGILGFTFVGGEAAIHPDLPELIQACEPSKTYLSLASNAWILSEERIKRFYAMGIDKINISIDSWNPEEHDANRQKRGSHKRVFDAIDRCKRIGMMVSLSMVVFRDSTRTEGFQKTIDYALDNRVRLQFKVAVPLGSWQGRQDKLITKEDRDTLIRLHKKYPLFTSCSFSGGCPALQRVVTITAYGDVMPCNCIHISFGNLRQESLTSILEKGRKNRFFNTNYDGCLSGEHMEFIEGPLAKTYNADPYPPGDDEIFGRHGNDRLSA